MTRKHWYIFRHGLATHSKTGYGDRIYDAEVLPEGIPPVERLARYMTTLPYDHGLRSEFLRCQQTAAIVTTTTGRAFTADARLNEAVKEPFHEVRERVQGFVDDLEAASYQHIWICTHGIIIAGLKNWLTVGNFAPKHENDYIQPGELLRITPDGFEIVKFDPVV